MKRLLALLLFLPILMAADPVKTLAHKNATLRDEKGRIAGTCNTSGNTTTFRDGQGRIAGSASRSSDGGTTFRDAQGRLSGTQSTRGSSDHLA